MQDWWQTTFPKGRQSVKITDANGCPIAIAYGEKGQGQPIILFHGMASWSYSWQHCISPLSRYGRVICFDAKGSGFSDKPLEPESLEGRLIELERIITALCDQPAVLVAHSLGALLSLGLAETRPDLIDRLVVINPSIFPKQLPSWAMRLLVALPIEFVRTCDRWRLAAMLAPLLRQVALLARQEVVVESTHTSEEDLYWLTYPYIHFPNTIINFAAELRQANDQIQRLHRGEPNLIRPIQENLSQITCPTLVLWGEQDQWFPVEDGQILHRCLPNSHFEILPNCGHDAAASSAGLISAAILRFLQSTKPIKVTS